MTEVAQATGKSGKGVNVAGTASLSERIAGKLSEALEKYGKTKVEQAVEAAAKAISAFAGDEKVINELQRQIEAKREGTATYLFQLAKECVTLTMKGKRANLEDAADLMQNACWFAEDSFLVQDAERRGPGSTLRKMSDALPSWPPLKGDTLNAMKKAHLNPHKFEGPRKLRDGYKAWKEANPNGKSTRGAKERADTADVKVDKLPKRVAKTAEQMTHLTDSARSALAHMVGVVQSLSPDLQNKAAGMISQWSKQLVALRTADEAKEDAKEGITTKRAPIPARESDKPIATN